jgi:ATP-dependent Clp protease ATP-binding subunit ClpC
VFERFTDQARSVLALAQEEARLLNHSFIGTEHLLLGLVAEGEGIAAQALQSLGITLEAARWIVEETIGVAGTAPGDSPPFTPRAKKVLELSLREALAMNRHDIGSEHILLGLVREGEGVGPTVLVKLGAALPRVRQEVLRLMGEEATHVMGESPTQGGFQRRRAGGRRAPGAAPEGPCCPRCRGAIGDVARFRTIAVHSDSGDTEAISVDVVYCLICGTTLHMFRGERTT